jgi:hypothetical protein
MNPTPFTYTAVSKLELSLIEREVIIKLDTLKVIYLNKTLLISMCLCFSHLQGVLLTGNKQFRAIFQLLDVLLHEMHFSKSWDNSSQTVPKIMITR